MGILLPQGRVTTVFTASLNMVVIVGSGWLVRTRFNAKQRDAGNQTLFPSVLMRTCSVVGTQAQFYIWNFQTQHFEPLNLSPSYSFDKIIYNHNVSDNYNDRIYLEDQRNIVSGAGGSGSMWAVLVSVIVVTAVVSTVTAVCGVLVCRYAYSTCEDFLGILNF